MPDLFEPFQLTKGQQEISGFQKIESDSFEASESQNSTPQSTPTNPSPQSPAEPPADSESNSNESNKHQATDTPKLIIDRENGHIVRIRVLCSCGLSTTLKCSYEESAEPQTQIPVTAPQKQTPQTPSPQPPPPSPVAA